MQNIIKKYGTYALILFAVYASLLEVVRISHYLKYGLFEEDYIIACNNYSVAKNAKWRKSNIEYILQCVPGNRNGYVRSYNPTTNETHTFISWQEFKETIREKDSWLTDFSFSNDEHVGGINESPLITLPSE